MFTITAKDMSNVRRFEESFLSRSYAIDNFLRLITACDVREVVMVNGLTGEVVYQWINGKWEVFDGICR